MTVKEITAKYEIEKLVHETVLKCRQMMDEAMAQIAKLDGDQDDAETRMIELISED